MVATARRLIAAARTRGSPEPLSFCGSLRYKAAILARM